MEEDWREARELEVVATGAVAEDPSGDLKYYFGYLARDALNDEHCPYLGLAGCSDYGGVVVHSFPRKGGDAGDDNFGGGGEESVEVHFEAEDLHRIFRSGGWYVACCCDSFRFSRESPETRGPSPLHREGRNGAFRRVSYHRSGDTYGS